MNELQKEKSITKQKKGLGLANLCESNLFPQLYLMAYPSEGQIILDEESLYLFQRYSSYEVSFIAVMGQKGAGKSILLDTITNLCGFGGSNFSKQIDVQSGILLWSVPFIIGGRQNVFLIQCFGIDFESQLEREQQILIDLLMLLSNSVIVIESAQQSITIENSVREEIQLSKKRILQNNTQTTIQSGYWPNSVHYLHRSMTPIDLSQCFKRCDYLSLPCIFQTEGNNQGKISHNYIEFAHFLAFSLLACTPPKCYLGLKYTGNITCKLLINTIKYMNKKSNAKIDKIFISIIKELYQSALEYHMEMYDSKLEQYFSDQEPFEFDELIGVFEAICKQVLQSFNNVSIEQKLHEHYEGLLMEHISHKQKLLLEINTNKTENQLINKLKDIQAPTSFDMEDLQDYIEVLSQLEPRLTHNRTIFVSAKLNQYSTNLQHRFLKEKMDIERQHFRSIKQSINQNKNILISIKQEKNEIKKQNSENQKNFKKQNKEEQKFIATIKKLNKQIANEKKFQKQFIISKKEINEYAEDLLQQIRQLEFKQRQGLKTIEQINKDFQYDPQILNLTNKLEEYERKIREISIPQTKIEQGKIKRSIAKGSINEAKSKSNMKLSPPKRQNFEYGMNIK